MARRPRILHVYKDFFPPVRGGIENTINLMARGCLDEFDVSVLVCGGTSGEDEEMIDGVRVVRVREWTRLWSAPIAPDFVRALSREAQRTDLLHFHHPNPTGDLAYLLRGHRKPFVITYHSDVVRQRAAMLIYGFLQRFMMRHAAVIMPTSPDYIASSASLRPHKEKCQVVPLGIEIERFTPTPGIVEHAQEIRRRMGTPIVLFVGRLRYYKGLHFLIEAMRAVEAQLVVVGSGPEESFLREKVLQAGLEERVHFVGELDDAELLWYLYAADIFCLPSHLRSEAFGICQIEAMACGVPVVSTALDTGVPFVNKHGETGLVVPPADPQALASALNRLLADDNLRRTFGEAARRRAATLFSAQRMNELVKRVYRKVLNE